MKDEADEELVLFRNGEMMTFVTGKRLVFTLGPAVIRRLHQMTAHAKFRIVLGKIIELVGNKTAAENDHEHEDCDEHLRFQRDGLFNPLSKTCYFSPKPLYQLHGLPLNQNSNLSLVLTKRAFITYEKVNVNTLQEYFYNYIVTIAPYYLDNFFSICYRACSH